jgi:orotidine-5'-phosphate decarboxylase
LTVHAGGGEAMLRAASEAAQGRLRVLAVTVLTSLDDGALRGLDLPGGIEARVERWTRLALEAGCAGVVCSAVEAARLRPLAPRPFLLVTPGIRGGGEESGDQRRTASPAQALAAGSDLLVIGRPLTRAADPLAALAALAVDLATRG